VPLARAYIAKGPEFYANAESALRSVIENNPQVTPEAREFRDSLMELAQLCYRRGQYEQAIVRLDELSLRYPGDEHFGQLLFLMGDSYRKSAAALDEALKVAAATTRPAIDIPEATKARKDRLARARDLYVRAIAYYRAPQRVLGDLDHLYLKLAYFYKADCVYDLGDYLTAIREYDDAAFRYQDDPAALAAYVQIVNANIALGRPEAAKAANERAKELLDRMPKDRFEGSSYLVPKPLLQQWLRSNGESGLWK
jgi:tetratricopeptide (TPR) repeat protein